MALAFGQFLVFAFLGIAFWALVRATPLDRLQRVDVNSREEEATLMFGAASVASTLMTAMLAILAILSWVGIKEIVQQRVDESIKEYQKVDLAKMKTRVGTLYGQLSQDTIDKGKLLDYAVFYLRQAYEEVKGRNDEDLVAILNNFAFYLALKEKPDSARADEVLKLAAQFRARNLVGQETNYLTTYGLMIGKFARSSQDIPPTDIEHLIGLTQALVGTKDDAAAQRNLPLLKKALDRVQATPQETSGQLFGRWVRSLFRST